MSKHRHQNITARSRGSHRKSRTAQLSPGATQRATPRTPARMPEPKSGGQTGNRRSMRTPSRIPPPKLLTSRMRSPAKPKAAAKPKPDFQAAPQEHDRRRHARRPRRPAAATAHLSWLRRSGGFRRPERYFSITGLSWVRRRLPSAVPLLNNCPKQKTRRPVPTTGQNEEANQEGK